MLNKCRFLPLFALVFVLAAGITAYAEGWSQSGNYWVYTENNNEPVINEWRKGTDGKWRWLDSYGHMAVNSWVDDVYFVDGEGIMLADTWQKIMDDGEPFWYYFQNSGKKVQNAWKEVGGSRYYFDESGHMLTGWILDNTYYCNEDGKMRTGWQYLPDPEDSYRSYTDPFESTEDTHWYYFQSSGKKYGASESASGYTEKRIDGKKYCFDVNGAMMTGWVHVLDEDGIQAYRYYNTDGSLRTGWYSLNPPESMERHYDQDVVWFYFGTSGAPYAAADTPYKAADVLRIGSKRYLFDIYGAPLYGLQKIYTDNGNDWTAYCFGTSVSNCSVLTGKQTVTEGDGTRTTFYFGTNGAGLTGVKDGYLYYKGKLQKAESGTSYQAIEISGGQTYLVSTAGKIAKSKTVKDADGNKYKTDGAGHVISLNDVPVTDYKGIAATEPYFN